MAPYKDLTSKPVTSALRRVAEYHGYTAQRGPRAGQGNVVELALAIGSGELATVLLPDEQRSMAIRWLNEQAQQVSDLSLAEALKSIADQLYTAVLRESED